MASLIKGCVKLLIETDLIQSCQSWLLDNIKVFIYCDNILVKLIKVGIYSETVWNLSRAKLYLIQKFYENKIKADLQMDSVRCSELYQSLSLPSRIPETVNSFYLSLHLIYKSYLKQNMLCFIKWNNNISFFHSFGSHIWSHPICRYLLGHHPRSHWPVGTRSEWHGIRTIYCPHSTNHGGGYSYICWD